MGRNCDQCGQPLGERFITGSGGSSYHHDCAAEVWEVERREAMRVRIDLKARSPMRAAAEQHDESELALFRSSDEPRLI